MELFDTVMKILEVLGWVLTPIWAIYQYIITMKREKQIREFEQFHKQVQELVQPSGGSSSMFLDRQAAIIFELRNYERYYEYSFRMLNALKEGWSKYYRLTNKIDYTIAFIKKDMNTKCCKKWLK